jgi:hypothetical protein
MLARHHCPGQGAPTRVHLRPVFLREEVLVKQRSEDGRKQGVRFVSSRPSATVAVTRIEPLAACSAYVSHANARKWRHSRMRANGDIRGLA